MERSACNLTERISSANSNLLLKLHNFPFQLSNRVLGELEREREGEREGERERGRERKREREKEGERERERERGRERKRKRERGREGERERGGEGEREREGERGEREREREITSKLVRLSKLTDQVPEPVQMLTLIHLVFVGE